MSPKSFGSQCSTKCLLLCSAEERHTSLKLLIVNVKPRCLWVTAATEPTDVRFTEVTILNNPGDTVWALDRTSTPDRTPNNNIPRVEGHESNLHPLWMTGFCACTFSSILKFLRIISRRQNVGMLFTRVAQSLVPRVISPDYPSQISLAFEHNVWQNYCTPDIGSVPLI